MAAEEIKDTENQEQNTFQEETVNQEEAQTENMQQENGVEQNESTETESVENKETVVEEKSEVELLQEKLAGINDKYLRLSAEFDNYRKRTLKEKMDLTKSAGQDILTSILPVVDNFERALKAMDSAKEIDAVKEGINLIYTNFKEFLKQRGVKEMEAQAQVFDPDFHEALTKIPSPTEDLKGKVVDVIERGYMLNEKVIRFAKVVVGE